MNMFVGHGVCGLFFFFWYFMYVCLLLLSYSMYVCACMHVCRRVHARACEHMDVCVCLQSVK